MTTLDRLNRNERTHETIHFNTDTHKSHSHKTITHPSALRVASFRIHPEPSLLGRSKPSTNKKTSNTRACSRHTRRTPTTRNDAPASRARGRAVAASRRARQSASRRLCRETHSFRKQSQRGWWKQVRTHTRPFTTTTVSRRRIID